ncbi:hypothetical protein GN958_ATG16342 [Phytophthora infestans]|uniref:Uncharacterized protein n=1 Tax=Phytophthora infestans TaxID=4787 RepID=A0A8S9U0J3_PHYIN|nr:hypothetical protein GN958_ATG16342 [Phytophthora infestans]
MAARIKDVLKRYGRTAFLFNSTVFASTLAGSYAAINAGTLALAYLSTVATGPARGALTIAASPFLARLLVRTRQLTKM